MKARLVHSLFSFGYEIRASWSGGGGWAGTYASALNCGTPAKNFIYRPNDKYKGILAWYARASKDCKGKSSFSTTLQARRHEQFHCGREFLKQEITYCTTYATTCMRCTCDLHLVRSSLVVVQKKYFLSVFTRRKLVLVCRPV